MGFESIRASCPEVPICARLDPSEPKRFRLRPRDAGAPALATRCPSVTGRDSYSRAMRLEHDPEAASWLDGLAGDSEEFDWDDGTKTKHAKHGVEPAEIKALFRHPLLFAGRIVEPSHPEPALARPRDDERRTAPRADLHPSRRHAAADKRPSYAKKGGGGL